MKSRFLIQKIHQDAKYIFNCTMLDENIVGNTEDECNELLRKKLDHFLATEGRRWVEHFKGDLSTDGTNIVNCPDGFILLPLDAWHCKHDKESCGLAIDISDEDRFLAHCRSEKKIGILQSVKNKKYDGFHHVLGRYLCPLCDEKLSDKAQNFKYHYPWELYPLWECIDFDTEEAFWVFQESKLPRSIGFSKVCADCFVTAITKFCPNDPLYKSLFVVEMNFYPR